MDEPTTALTQREVARLFMVVEKLSAQGVALIFVSHKLDEVMAISQRVTIMRSGRNVIDSPVEDLDREKITHYTVSYTHLDVYKRQRDARNRDLLALDRVLRVLSPRRARRIHDDAAAERLLARRREERVNAVSYTHLDVYKRQSRPRPTTPSPTQEVPAPPYDS